MSAAITSRFVSRLTRKTLALILAGGRGSRLKQLTLWRAKPATPFGGKYRIIDFPLSNCLNSGIRRVCVLTQYKAHSLIQHVQRGWGFLRGEFGEFVELLPAQQRIDETSWYRGTADAVYQNLDIIRTHEPEFVLILAGDHIYKMDYGPMLALHVESKADVTIGSVEVPQERAREFGVLTVTPDKEVIRFTEKPDHPETLPGRENMTLASMGIYVFNRQFLFERLIEDAETVASGHDFGKDVLPKLIGRHRVITYPFCDVQTKAQSYWRDVGTVDAFWEANMELAGVDPELNLYDEHWPIWTYQEQLPPAKFVFDDEGRRGMAVDSLVADGCIISGGCVNHSVLFPGVQVHSYVRLRDAVVLPGVDIGRYCQLDKVIIDRACVIPPGTVVGDNPQEDARRFYRTEKGVVLITREMLGQESARIR
ncbi:glucose-1-phosphate adenylyltransferase [Candidatus Competibacter denitrificans Run_A_D11]|jgi:glucose-1-phosphate adenylyltransferase|uniref:Glucose-1-phosphate adenylyltransferase n=1 Tax=Candidatus Competibacter denitrificans Run_A_D11 TaxID=1400863 RepID=W6MAC3_9GAMM|nr:glucose-1-phosphate adenylyltransferase [Candidatus Competibacter denitrificans]CDI03669.1 glucose-1-phosphate adenylyltransferase [Candidatus Competibacter denitrificans Run_A_D11]HAS86758.1 glucose-1-phosphate adenylyltransferase [Candidatus Competibacteraceae bacterium]HRC68349.1 glucose-1-phosphate adenylyltransferase [Candidatus Competibacter denitrificans]